MLTVEGYETRRASERCFGAANKKNPVGRGDATATQLISRQHGGLGS